MVPACASRCRVARASLRLDLEIARRSFHRYSTYRAATLAGCFTNTVFGFLRVFVLLAVVAERGEVGGLGARDVATYVFLSQGLISAVGTFNELELGERIRTGAVVVDFHRPVDLERYWLAEDLGRVGYQAIARGLPPFLAGALVFDLRLPTSLAQWGAVVVSVGLAAIVSFSLRFVSTLTGFWVLDARGAVQLMAALCIFLSGFLVPVNFFPAWLADIAYALPFVAILQLPAEIFLGTVSGVDVLGVLAVQAFWAVALLGLGRMVLGRATRKVVVHGG